MTQITKFKKHRKERRTESGSATKDKSKFFLLKSFWMPSEMRL